MTSFQELIEKKDLNGEKFSKSYSHGIKLGKIYTMEEEHLPQHSLNVLNNLFKEDGFKVALITNKPIQSIFQEIMRDNENFSEDFLKALKPVFYLTTRNQLEDFELSPSNPGGIAGKLSEFFNSDSSSKKVAVLDDLGGMHLRNKETQFEKYILDLANLSAETGGVLILPVYEGILPTQYMNLLNYLGTKLDHKQIAKGNLDKIIKGQF